MTDQEIATANAVYDFMRTLNDYITNRVKYDRDGPKYAGENPPDDTEITNAFCAAVQAVVKGSFK